MSLTWTNEQAASNPGTSGNVALPSNVKNGSLLVAYSTGDATFDPAEVPTDTLLTTFVRLARVSDATNNVAAVWWYGIAPGAGADTVAFPNSNNFDSYCVAEISVSSGTISLDTKDAGNLRNHTNATDNITSNSISTSVTDVLVVGFNVDDGADVTISAGTGFVKIPNAETHLEGFAGNPTTLESLTKASPGSTAATFTSNVSGRGMAFVAAFKSSAASGVTAGPKRFAGPLKLTNTAATLFTSSGRSLIEEIHVQNPSASPVDLTLSVGTDAAGTRIMDGLAIAADSEKKFRFVLPLENGEIMQGFASTTAVLDITIDGRVL